MAEMWFPALVVALVVSFCRVFLPMRFGTPTLEMAPDNLRAGIPVPIAAKFSEAFYQKFGHAATGELVEYLNTIDSTYRAELERLNDANWKRVEARIAQVEAKLDQRAGELRAEMRAGLAELKAELLKWMFLFWLGTIGTVIALQRLGG